MPIKRKKALSFVRLEILQHFLEYSKWDNFIGVISKAKTAC